MTPDDYNSKQLVNRKLTIEHVTRLVEYFQRGSGLPVDGKAGPKTIAALVPAVSDLQVVNGWLVGPRVTKIPAYANWYGGPLVGGVPKGIVAHYTATDPGTALNMANRRAQPFVATAKKPKPTSWHVSVESDGSLVQMVPFTYAAWHAGGPSALPVAGIGQVNYATVGIELVGWGREFPAAQVEGAMALWRALVRAYGIARKYAMLAHSDIDPTRRSDPGPVWTRQHAANVVTHAYA